MNEKDKKILFLVNVLLITGVTLGFTTIFEQAFVIPKRFFLRFFTVIYLLAWLYYQIRAEIFFKPRKSMYIAFIYLATVFVSLLFSINPISGFDLVIDLTCLVIVFIVTLSLDKEYPRKLANFLLVIALAVGVYSIIQHLGLDPVAWHHQNLVKNRSISTLGNPDFLSAFLVMIIPLIFACVYEKTNDQLWGFYLASWGFLCLVNVFTYSRAGLVSMFLGLAVTVIILGKKTLMRNRRRTIIVVIILAVAFMGVVAMESMGKTRHSLINRIKAFVNPGEINVSTRLYLWKAGWLIFLDNHLTGTGPGTLSIAFLPYRYLEPVEIRHLVRMPESTHNIFLDVAFSSGVFALTAFVAFAVYLLIKVYRCTNFSGKSGDSSSGRWLVAGYAGGLTAFYVHHLAGFSTLPTDLLFWVFAAINVILCAPDVAGKKTEPLPKKKWNAYKITAIAAVFIVGIVLLCNTAQKTAADYYFRKGKIYQAVITEVKSPRNRDLKEIIDKGAAAFNRAVQLNSLEQNYWLNRGKFFEESSYKLKDPQQLTPVFNQAVYSYARAIDLQPRNPYPHADMGRLLSRWGYYNEALRFFRKAVSLDPYNPLLRNDLAILLEKMGKYDQAEKMFKSVIKVYDRGPWVYGNLGIFYYKTKQYKKARFYLKKALKIDPDRQEYRNYLKKIKNRQ